MTLDQVEIAMADAAGSHFDQDFVFFWFGLCDIFNCQRSPNSSENGSVHDRA